MFSFVRHGIGAVAMVVAAIATTPVSAYDLKTDWSDSANPNGPWSYREGSIVLPHTGNWTAGVSFPVTQPAYQPANANGNFLPSWFKMTNTLATFDTQVGDIVVHTNDNSNGNEGLGRANVLFTAPVAVQYHIFGNLWNASTTLVPSDFRPRPQDWQILVNGVVQDSGVLDAIPGHFTRSSPDTFDLLTVTLSVGGTIELDVFRDAAAAAGFFVGTNLTIDPVGSPPPPAIPEPTTLPLLAAGLIGFSITRRRWKSGG
jgi:hypothetical protein